jgi:hypothetical protein
MKKLLSLVLASSVLLTLAACGQKLDASISDNGTGFTYKVKGTSGQKTVYLRTEADGIKKLQVKNGKFKTTIPARSTRQEVELSESENFDNEITVKSNKAKPIMNYEKFAARFNDNLDYLDGDTEYVPETSSGYHSYETGLNEIDTNTDNGNLLAFNLYTDSIGNKAFASYLTAMVDATGGSQDDVTAGLEKAVKKHNQYITISTGGLKYTMIRNVDKDKLNPTTLNIFVYKQ